MRKRPLRSDRVAASTIPGDDADLRLLRQPGFSRSWLPIRQESDCRMSLKVADQRAVAVVAPPGPVIDADNRGWRKVSWSSPPNHAQQRVVAHFDVEPMRKGGGRPAAKRNRETVDHVVESVRTSGPRFDRPESFGKDPPCASRSVTEEAAGPQNQRYPHAGGRKITQPSPILAVHAAANASAHRAAANSCRASYRDHEAIAVSRRALNHEAARNKLRNVKSLHCSDPQPESEPNRRLEFIKSESDPKIDPAGTIFSHEISPSDFDGLSVISRTGPDAVVAPIVNRFAELDVELDGAFMAGNTGAFWRRSGGIPVLPNAALLRILAAI
jgi:hypothetical protein